MHQMVTNAENKEQENILQVNAIISTNNFHLKIKFS